MATAKRVPARKTAAHQPPAIGGNGLQSFSMHVEGRSGTRMRGALRAAPAARGAGAAAAPVPASRLDPESAAQRYLQRALQSQALPEFTDPQGAIDAPGRSEFQRLGTESVPLTNTRTVKYRQTINKIPVYGSLVTVELDQDNECLAIHSALGAPKGISPIARVSPQAALDLVAKTSGNKASALRATPRLSYYFDGSTKDWWLVYIVENVPNRAREPGEHRHQAALHDYVVDALSGRLLSALPRTPSAASPERGVDDRGVERRFSAERGSTLRTLTTAELGVRTFTFGFRDPQAPSARLPGRPIERQPPAAWPPSAVSAHANAEAVARFLRDVLLRHSIDGEGGPLVSTIECVVKGENDGPRQWLNAYWDPEVKQMVYGQRLRANGAPFSIAAMLDIVAHEMFHGVTDCTARLEYAAQSGAMNESYSDIFGVIVQNIDRADRQAWDWRVGVGFETDGVALRDLKSPQAADPPQPANMDGYRRFKEKPRARNDWGGVHTNSGIHNHAAFKIMSARAGGKPTFSTAELAALFYLALTQYLSRTSEFADSRRALLLVARTLFRNDAPAVRARKTRAIERGFAVVGIDG